MIGIVGLGYVGLNLLLNLSKKNFNIIGYDVDRNKIKKLQKSESTISYIKDTSIKKTKKNVTYSIEFNDLNICDIIIVCLPTPLKSNKYPDLSHLYNISDHLKNVDLNSKVIILESTSYPGTTREVFSQCFLKQSLIIGKNAFLGFSPERENPGSKEFTFYNTPKVVSGFDKNSSKIIQTLYSMIVKKTIIAPTMEIAESAKLLENIFRSVNIGMINEMRFALDKMNIDIHRVIKVAKTKPFGFMPFYPGPGVGGHCIPIDPLYFSWKSKQFNYKTQFIELASKTNIEATKNISNQILKIINNNDNKKKGLIFGLSYKKNIEDTRESASLKILNFLYKKKIKVEFCDFYVKQEFVKIDKKTKKLLSINLNYKNLRNYSHTIIATDHDNFDYEKIYKNSNLIIDLRKRYKDSQKVICI